MLEGATRSFALTPERSRTLKELFVRRRKASGPRAHALRDVDLRVAPGEAVGMIGRNGAGKSSTLRCLAQIIPLDSGRADCGGRVLSLLELGAGFGPDFSGRENIYLNGALHGFTREEVESRMDDIVKFSELGEFIDVPVKAYSSGMFLRLGFSIVAHLRADVLLIDEILAVGDESFQRKCLRRISGQMAAGATVVLVSHDPTAIERVCGRVVVLDRGEVAFDGDVAEGLLHYHRVMGTEAGDSESLRPGVAPPLSVIELELRDDLERRRHMFRAGDALTVHMRLRAVAPLEHAGIALEVRDEAGRVCFRTNAPLGRVDDEVEASFEVPRLTLLGGDFDLAVGAEAGDGAGAPVERLARFSVAHESEAEGVVDLRGRWRIAGRSGQEALR